MLFPLDTIVAFMLAGFMCEAYRQGLLAPAVPYLGPASLLAALAAATGCCRAMVFAAGMRLRRHDLDPLDTRRLVNLVNLLARVIAVGLYFCVLQFGRWPLWILPRLGLGHPLLLQTGAILAYVCLLLATWIPLFSLHRLVHGPDWTVFSYLLHRARYSLFVLGIWVPMLLLMELSRAGDGARPPTAVAAILDTRPAFYGAMLLLAWVFPFFLRFFWGCVRLPDGPLRERIRALEHDSGIVFSEIFLWDFGGASMLNAAAVGFFRPFRYLFLSRGLIDNLPPEEIDAVVCHEAGHVRHQHLVFYMLTTMAALTMAEVACGLIFGASSGYHEQLLAFACLLLMVAVYFRVCFGFLSRRMERQADLNALAVMGTAAPMIRALERISLLSGNIRDLESWHHMSIARRVAFLREAQRDPRLVQAHQAHVRLVKRLGYAFALAVALAWGGLALETNPRDGLVPAAPASGQSEFAHWRRVTRLMPERAVGWLGLARFLAGGGEQVDARVLDRALACARRAQSTAATAPERLAAARLLAELQRRRDSSPGALAPASPPAARPRP